MSAVRLGLIARADHRGLAIQTAGMHRALQPLKTMIIDCPSAKPLPLHLDQFPGDGVTVVKGWPTERDFRPFLDGLDVVYTAECDYTRDGLLYSLADQMGVKTALHVNYEFLPHVRNPSLPRPSLFAAPSMWHYDDIPDPKKYLPVPIETDRFPERPHRAQAKTFLHIVGRPAIHDRNGSTDLLDALQHVRSDVKVRITCQDPQYIPKLLPGRRIPSNVELVIESGDVLNHWELYADADVLVMPRRFGGLCLPANEALGAGLPVAMPNISPNNSWLPSEWLVPAVRSGDFMAHNRIDLHETDPVALAAKIDKFAGDPEFYVASADTARRMAKELSWDQMRPMYEQVFADLCRKARTGA